MFLEIINNISLISIAFIFVIIMYMTIKDTLLKTKVFGFYIWKSFYETKHRIKTKVFGERDDQ